MRLVFGLSAALLIAGCSRKPAETPANEVAAKPAKLPHCFFKDSEIKDWAVKAAGDTIVLTGRAFRSDPRYKAVLLEPEIADGVAVVRPLITINDTGFAAEGNWWDVKAAIPAAGLRTVEVRCGKAVLASLQLAAAAG